MKYLLLSFLLPFLYDGTASKVEWQVPMEHDFGDILHKKPVEVDFIFVNVSDEPFVIDNVRTTCGCTAPDWQEEPVMPGDTSKIHIVFDAKKTGYFHKKAKVFFSGQRKGETLHIEGYVYKDGE